MLSLNLYTSLYKDYIINPYRSTLRNICLQINIHSYTSIYSFIDFKREHCRFSYASISKGITVLHKHPRLIQVSLQIYIEPQICHYESAQASIQISTDCFIDLYRHPHRNSIDLCRYSHRSMQKSIQIYIYISSPYGKTWTFYVGPYRHPHRSISFRSISIYLLIDRHPCRYT